MRAILLLLTSTFLWTGCGESHEMLGDLCGLPECEYDELGCQFFLAPNEAYKVYYINQRSDRYLLAGLVIDLIGLPDQAQFRLEGSSLNDRVLLVGFVPEEYLSDVIWRVLDVFEGGLEAGRTLRGRMVGTSPRGDRVELAFDCPLESALPE